MSRYINSNKDLFCGDRYFFEHVMPKEFDYRAHKKELSAYFEKYGYKVSMMYNDYYSQLNGVISDQYVSMDVYYFYILPCLNKGTFESAYTDKNMYSALLGEFPQPKTIIKNMNGHWLNADSQEITIDEVCQILLMYNDEMIIKPTVDTCNGDGVSRFLNKGRQEIVEQLKAYKKDFIIQEKVIQHHSLSLFNTTSLNTVRIFTYRTLSGDIVVLPHSLFFRFGGKGAVKDNASAGGGFCKVYIDGSLEDTIYHFCSMKKDSFAKDMHIIDPKLPNIEDAYDLVKKMHMKMVYFDVIGWDIAFLEDGSPIFIEMNTKPSCEAPQIPQGPLFGDRIDEIMERVSHCEREVVTFQKNNFDNGNYYMLQIS